MGAIEGACLGSCSDGCMCGFVHYNFRIEMVTSDCTSNMCWDSHLRNALCKVLSLQIQGLEGTTGDYSDAGHEDHTGHARVCLEEQGADQVTVSVGGRSRFQRGDR